MESNAFKYRDELKQRTKSFALRIVKLYQSLPKTTEAQLIGKQIFRSGTSVAANYRAACRARSNSEYFSKISIVIEEAMKLCFGWKCYGKQILSNMNYWKTSITKMKKY